VRRRRRYVRRASCPTCGVEVGITRGELHRRIVQCVCGARFALDVEDAGAGPHREMERLGSRVLMAGPPTARIEERLGPVPTLIIRQERGEQRRGYLLLLTGGLVVLGAAAAYGSPLSVLFVAAYVAATIYLLANRERVRVVDGVLEHGRERVPLDAIVDVRIDGPQVVVDGRGGERLRLLDADMDHAAATREWVVAWIREQMRRR
jgi:hypothetical protein